MHAETISINGCLLLALPPASLLVHTERDVLDVVALCGEHNTQRVLCHAANFVPDFFDLKTGLAGIVFQKFTTYFITAAMVIDPGMHVSQRFKELMLESNQGAQFRFFADRATAESWLAKQ